MTIRQLYYTSCREGRDGIQGFQVNAASAGLDRRHEDRGLRLGAYRPGPAAPPSPNAEELARLPVAFGYQRDGETALLVHSRYLGADFTGRQGNYFAHVLVLDAPSDLAGMLPIDVWRSPVWRWDPSSQPTLPPVDTLPTGPLADRERLRNHLLAGGTAGFRALLSAVQQGLAGRISKVVVVADDTEQIALAVAAVAVSLPRPLATALSFLTFSATPADVDVLVVGTTPDVRVPANPFGGQVVVRLDGGDVGAEPPTRYADVLAACWEAGTAAVTRAVATAERIAPPPAVDDLDALADLLELAVPELTPSHLLEAVEFAVTRAPALCTPALWQRVDDCVRAAGGVRDVGRWSAVRRSVDRAGGAVGPELDAAYLRAVLTAVASGSHAPRDLWIQRGDDPHRERLAREWARATLQRTPTLDTAGRVLQTLAAMAVPPTDDDIAFVVDRVVLAALLDPHEPDLVEAVDRLSADRRVLPAVYGMLEERIRDDAVFDGFVEDLPAAAAALLRGAPPGSRCALAATLVRARTRQESADPVRAVKAAVEAHVGRPEQTIERFGRLLWPDPPTAAEGVRLFRAFPPAVLGATTFPRRMVDRIVADADGPGLRPEHAALADLLAKKPIGATLGSGLDIVDGVRFGAYFDSRPTAGKESARAAVDAVEEARRLPPAIRGWLLGRVVAWLFGMPATEHGPMLLEVLEAARSGDFATAYDRELGTLMRTEKPQAVAATLPAVVYAAYQLRSARPLVETTCREALAGRRKRELDDVGKYLGHREKRLAGLLSDMGENFPASFADWWSSWRATKLQRRSGLGRLFGGKPKERR